VNSTQTKWGKHNHAGEVKRKKTWSHATATWPTPPPLPVHKLYIKHERATLHTIYPVFPSNNPSGNREQPPQSKLNHMQRPLDPLQPPNNPSWNRKQPTQSKQSENMGPNLPGDCRWLINLLLFSTHIANQNNSTSLSIYQWWVLLEAKIYKKKPTFYVHQTDVTSPSTQNVFKQPVAKNHSDTNSINLLHFNPYWITELANFIAELVSVTEVVSSAANLPEIPFTLTLLFSLTQVHLYSLGSDS